MVDERRMDPGAIQVRAPNGVVWTRAPDGHSSPDDLFAQLDQLTMGHIQREWDWWQEDRRDQEHDRQWAILREWDNGAPEPTDGLDPDAWAQAYMDKVHRDIDTKRQQRAELAAKHYDEARERVRLTMLRAEADAAFFAHVLEKPASPAQRDKAEQRTAQQQAAARELRGKLGDPDEVIDRNGFYPAERRGYNLDSHMSIWRHRMLRQLHESKQRSRFRALLAMRPVEPDAMCSECQAPSQWHGYALSLCLLRAAPEPGSTAEKLANLMPGWWQRCSACTVYQIEHQWGGHAALPDFDGQQWAAMLPPPLKAIFAPNPARPGKHVARPKPLAVITAGDIDDVHTQLTEAKARFPGAVIRAGRNGMWELWPGTR